MARLTRAELIAALERIIAVQQADERRTDGGDAESDHKHADDLLLAYIGDADVIRLFEAIDRWYA